MGLGRVGAPEIWEVGRSAATQKLSSSLLLLFPEDTASNRIMVFFFFFMCVCIAVHMCQTGALPLSYACSQAEPSWSHMPYVEESSCAPRGGQGPLRADMLTLTCSTAL
jgi:hypothetical protein